MSDSFTVRPATTDDSSVATALLHLTMGYFATHLFGAGDTTRTIRILTQLFVRQQNRLSHQFTDVVETNGQVVGLVLSYPAMVMGKLGMSMSKQLWNIYGGLGFVRLAVLSLPMSFAHEADADEYFINTLAVSPDYQGRGIGTHLLQYAEEKARDAQCAKCSLSVDVSNVDARRLYERMGFQVAETIRFDWFKFAGLYQNYHRMVKRL